MELEEYVAARAPALLRLGFLLTGDAHAAQDLVQSALLQASRRWSRIAHLDHPDAYVHKMLVNTFLSERRRRSASERPVATFSGEASSSADVEAVVERDALRTTLSVLTSRERTVLVLRYYMDCDDESIADLLAVSQSTVRTTAKRALAKAKNSWSETEFKEPDRRSTSTTTQERR